MAKITRKEYAAMYGPTKGDAVRLGDTSLLAEIEHDYAVPGDECLHGGGKTLRDGMGLKSGFDSIDGALDMLICNATIIDPVLGIVKGDIGIKDGKIVAVGKAGNPEVMDGVHPKLICGVATTVRDAEGLVATPGGIDVHVHFDSAQLCEHAIASGLTTMIGGSLGRSRSASTAAASGTSARCCRPRNPGRSTSAFSAAATHPSRIPWQGSCAAAAWA